MRDPTSEEMVIWGEIPEVAAEILAVHRDLWS